MEGTTTKTTKPTKPRSLEKSLFKPSLTERCSLYVCVCICIYPSNDGSYWNMCTLNSLKQLKTDQCPRYCQFLIFIPFLVHIINSVYIWTKIERHYRSIQIQIFHGLFALSRTSALVHSYLDTYRQKYCKHVSHQPKLKFHSPWNFGYFS